MSWMLMRPASGWVARRRRMLLAVGLAGTLAVVVLTLLVAAHIDLGRVEDGAGTLAAGSSAGAVSWSKWLEVVGGTLEGLVVVAALGAWLWWRGRRVEAAVAVLVVVGTMGIVGVLKVLVNRERPLDALVVEDDPYSFPSGHAARAAVFAVVATFLVARSSQSRLTPTLVGVLGAFWVVLVSWSRLALRVHHLWDVTAGALIGLIVGLFGILLVDVIAEQPEGWAFWRWLRAS